jgi:phosphatidate cytidylyltransferase
MTTTDTPPGAADDEPRRRHGWALVGEPVGGTTTGAAPTSRRAARLARAGRESVVRVDADDQPWPGDGSVSSRPPSGLPPTARIRGQVLDLDVLAQAGGPPSVPGGLVPPGGVPSPPGTSTEEGRATAPIRRRRPGSLPEAFDVRAAPAVVVPDQATMVLRATPGVSPGGQRRGVRARADGPAAHPVTPPVVSTAPFGALPFAGGPPAGAIERLGAPSSGQVPSGPHGLAHPTEAADDLAVALAVPLPPGDAVAGRPRQGRPEPAAGEGRGSATAGSDTERPGAHPWARGRAHARSGSGSWERAGTRVPAEAVPGGEPRAERGEPPARSDLTTDDQPAGDQTLADRTPGDRGVSDRATGDGALSRRARRRAEGSAVAPQASGRSVPPAGTPVADAPVADAPGHSPAGDDRPGDQAMGHPASGSQSAPQRRSRAGRNLPMAIAVGVGLGAVVLASLLIRKEAFVGVVSVAAVIAVWELASALATKKIAVPVIPLAVGSVGMLVSAFVAGEDGLLVSFALTSFGLLLWRIIDGPEDAARDVAASVFAAAYVPFLAGFAMLMLAAPDGARRIIVFVIVTISSDIGGYTAGVLFGQHPMAPTVSPHKSWEGFAGSALACMVGGTLGVVLLLGGVWWAGPVVGAAAVVTATVGDLSESLLKRDLGIKDMGTLLPGHGGMLDRLDSLLLTAPAVYVLLSLLVPIS